MASRLHRTHEPSGPSPGLFILLCALIGVIGYFTTSHGNATENWLTDFDAAADRSRGEARPMLVAFYMEDCGHCRAMDSGVLGEAGVDRLRAWMAEVSGAIADFVPVRIDVDKHPELANRYRVYGTPTFAVVDSEGHLLSRCEGYQPASAFVSFLKRAGRPVRAKSPQQPPPSAGL